MGDLISIRRSLLADSVSQLRTISGNPAVFRTRSKQPIENLYGSIIPILGGSGSPSPDNVRPISYYTEFTFNVNGETITVPCPTIPNTSLKTFYGATIDFTNGMLHATHWSYSTDLMDTTSRITSIGTLGSFTRFWIYIHSGVTQRMPGTMPICDSLPVNPSVGYSNYRTQALRMGVHDDYAASYWMIMPTALVGTTNQTIFDYLHEHPIKIVFVRKDQTGNYAIKKPEIVTQRGENIITSNLNGEMSFNYWS